MGNEISLNESFKNRVTKRMMEVFKEMMPESEIKSFCEKQLQAFKENDMEKVAKQMIEAEFRKMYASKLQELTQELYNHETQQYEMDENLKRLLIECAPAMLANMFKVEAHNAIRNYQAQVQNSGYHY